MNKTYNFLVNASDINDGMEAKAVDLVKYMVLSSDAKRMYDNIPWEAFLTSGKNHATMKPEEIKILLGEADAKVYFDWKAVVAEIDKLTVTGQDYVALCKNDKMCVTMNAHRTSRNIAFSAPEDVKLVLVQAVQNYFDGKLDVAEGRKVVRAVLNSLQKDVSEDVPEVFKKINFKKSDISDKLVLLFFSSFVKRPSIMKDGTYRYSTANGKTIDSLICDLFSVVHLGNKNIMANVVVDNETATETATDTKKTTKKATATKATSKRSKATKATATETATETENK